LHPTSLPGPYGIGEIGPAAVRFAQTLERTGQRLWQVLPLGPTGYGDSPYQALSAYAFNPLLISFDWLVDDGLLNESALETCRGFADDQVDYRHVIPARQLVLSQACRRFTVAASAAAKSAYGAFCAENEALWLTDFALFSALKQAHANQPWTRWPAALAMREPNALQRAATALRTQIEQHKVLQFLFWRQWQRIREACHARGIRIIGDLPISVAHDSAEVWAHRELFQLDAQGEPSVVAGVPPDYFSATGQRWGNPLYRWDVLEQDGFKWWRQRLRWAFRCVDIMRIDHFRGLEAYWEIPAWSGTAQQGRWVAGPRDRLLDALQSEFGELALIAEDLGVITPEVEALRDRYHLPGMRILQFAFGDDPMAPKYRPEAYIRDCVCYVGTHDNDTVVGWFSSNESTDSTRNQAQIDAERHAVLEYLGGDGSQIHWDMIGAALHSRAGMVILTLQDILGLDSSARLNTPGRSTGNWRWRFSWNRLTPEIQQRLYDLTQATERL
jgi:4-alpha-glucanotransferase